MFFHGIVVLQRREAAARPLELGATQPLCTEREQRTLRDLSAGHAAAGNSLPRPLLGPELFRENSLYGQPWPTHPLRQALHLGP